MIALSVTLKLIKDAFERRQEHTFFKDIRTDMRFCSKRILYLKGYKYCNTCCYIVNTDAYLCPVCGRLFKTTLINKEHDRTVKLYSEPFIKLGVIKRNSLIKGVSTK